jgi:hypothetical protein
VASWSSCLCFYASITDFPELHTTIGQNEWQVRLIVASEEDLKQLTSNVVLAEFKFVKGLSCHLILKDRRDIAAVS